MPAYWLDDFVNGGTNKPDEAAQPNNDGATAVPNAAQTPTAQQDQTPPSSLPYADATGQDSQQQPQSTDTRKPYAPYQRIAGLDAVNVSPYQPETRTPFKKEAEAKQYSPVVSETPSLTNDSPDKQRYSRPPEGDSLFGSSDGYGEDEVDYGDGNEDESGDVGQYGDGKQDDDETENENGLGRRDGADGDPASTTPTGDPPNWVLEMYASLGIFPEQGPAKVGEDDRGRSRYEHLTPFPPYREPSRSLSPVGYPRTGTYKVQYEYEQELKKKARAAAARAAAERRAGAQNEDAPDPDCGCASDTARCQCHPSQCMCQGCEYREEVGALTRDAERKRETPENPEEFYDNESDHEFEPLEDGSRQIGPQRHDHCCGGGRVLKRCVCLPGLCRCAGCHKHDVALQPEPAGSLFASHAIEGAPRLPPGYELNPISEGNTCVCRAGGFCRCLPGQCRCGKVQSQPLHPTYANQADRGEPFCVCSPGQCSCGVQSRPAQPCHTIQGDQAHDPCGCRAGKECLCPPGRCGCRKPQSAPEPWALQGEEIPGNHRLAAVPWNMTYGPRPLHLQLSGMIEHHADGSTTPLSTPHLMSGGLAVPDSFNMPAPSVSRLSPMPPSRPDTPRPHAESIPSTPYAADVLQDYVQQSVESSLAVQRSGTASPKHNFATPQQSDFRRSEGPGDTRSSQVDVRQSVEPEYPPPNWERQSTPAYEDRSFTPSPFSGTGDVDMRDASQRDNRLASQRPTPPPIPDSDIKQPKRADRRKSGVQGSKVEKRAVTGTKAKPKPKSRKPTASVGKLVEKAKKNNKEAADQEGAEGGPSKPLPKVGSKVSDAVKKIEEQVKQDGDKKQKDGSPLRRSGRATKGVRTSLGYGTP